MIGSLPQAVNRGRRIGGRPRRLAFMFAAG
jgi:hypothetical protein